MNVTSLMFANANLSKIKYNENSTELSFSGKTPKKLIAMMLESKIFHPKNIKLTFDEVQKIYQYLGYDVVMKRGSHAIVATELGNFPLVIPHRDKYVDIKDILRLRYLLLGDIQKALNL